MFNNILVYDHRDVINKIPAGDIKNLINKNGRETNRAPSEFGQGARFVDLLMTCFANYYDIIK